MLEVTWRPPCPEPWNSKVTQVSHHNENGRTTFPMHVCRFLFSIKKFAICGLYKSVALHFITIVKSKPRCRSVQSRSLSAPQILWSVVVLSVSWILRRHPPDRESLKLVSSARRWWLFIVDRHAYWRVPVESGINSVFWISNFDLLRLGFLQVGKALSLTSMRLHAWNMSSYVKLKIQCLLLMLRIFKSDWNLAQ